MRALRLTSLVCAASALTLRAPPTSAALRAPCYRLRIASSRMMCAEAPAPAAEAPPAEAVAAEGPLPFQELDVRVGKIVEAWEHPDSEKLWCERIDVGEEEPREIASGLRAHYASVEDMTGRSVIVVCNLKPAKLGGFPSNGMVLCASSPEGTVAFVEPPEGSAPGDRVLAEGAAVVEPASANRVKKKKLMEEAAKELKAVDTVATYKGMPLCTAAGPCKSPTVATGTIN